MAFFVEKVWTTLLLWLASATGLDPSGLFSIPSYPGQSIDLLASLGLHNSSRVGVEITVGPPPQLRTAYKLTGDFRDLKLPPSIFKQVADLLRTNPEFTISARLKQEPGNAGIIVSFAHGVNRYLELHSSGIKDEIRLHYTSSLDSIVYIETFRYPLADDRWHDVALSVSGAQVDLLIDCQPRFRRILKHGAVERNFSESQMQLWLGERNKQHFFKGIMQNVILTVGPYGYLASCQHLDTECPTCGQFYLLQNTVHELTRHLQELSERLVQAEKRISTVEECDCQKSCHVNGTVYADGFTWQSGCDLCSCVHGEVQCHPVECPEPDCKNPVSKSGECCLICKRRCLFYGQFYDHGESVTFKKCRECKCNDGNMKCFNIDPETNCPKLLCPPEEQFSVSDHCCKFCPDVDECQTAGDLMGHHCRANTRCVNTPGSYICECLPGYRRVDAFNCAEVDECGGGEHTCDVNADCINTQGSYDCACREGWSGDGYRCKPICPQGCLNGGVCVQPGQCACLNGYTGESCERDLDECAAGLHRCAPHAAVCVNMMGWYYCRCKEGYRDAGGFGYPYSRNNLGSECIDINECESDLHTCHPSAQCVNTNGSFSCVCPPSNTNCKLNCLYLDKEIENGKTINTEKDPCQKCTCYKGVIKCDKPKCDCNLPENDHNECCPQCNKKYACRHQELSGVILMHGEQWSYQCQTCECFYGDIDCYDMKCPPLLCDNPVRNPEDCCSHCEDPCSFGNMGNSSALGQNCTFRGRIIKSGDQFVDDNDPCTACNCKDGVLCCSYNYHCGYDSRPVGFDGVVAPLPIESDSSETAIDVHRQYSGAVRVANHSRTVSDSTSGG